MTAYNADPDFGLNTGGASASERRAAMQPSDPDVRAVVTIDEDDIDGELRDIAANLAYWAFLLNQARASLRRVKAERDRLIGSLDPTYRAELQKETGKKPTNDQVKAKIYQDPEYLEVIEDVADTDQRVSDLSVVCDSIRTKADCLRSLSANRRAELDALKTAT